MIKQWRRHSRTQELAQTTDANSPTGTPTRTSTRWSAASNDASRKPYRYTIRGLRRRWGISRIGILWTIGEFTDRQGPQPAAFRDCSHLRRPALATLDEPVTVSATRCCASSLLGGEVARGASVE
jgi:hypothetical protein